jgi:hypothetical protein
MILESILKDLTYGELQGLRIGNLLPGEATSEPDPHQYEQIISYLNLGMTELYKRFFLKSREIYLQEHAEISTYLLHSDYSLANTASAIAESERYIIDTPTEPFTDDILKIEEIYDEAGVRIPLNDINEELSIYTPSYRSVQIPYPNDNTSVSIQYRADATKVVANVATDASTVEVDCPNSLYEALLYYIGSRAHRASNMEKSNDYWMMFKKCVQDVDTLGLEVQGEPTSWRFDDHGWV